MPTPFSPGTTGEILSVAPTLLPEVGSLYPFTSRYLSLRCGQRMHYLDEGSGPPLLMLHGNPTWSFYYRNLVRGLRDRYRCIVPDHIGCGFSDKPRGWSYSIQAHADNLVELVSALDLRGFTLAVHDWGGPIGYLAALQFPERVGRFITFNSAVFLLPLPRLLTMMRLPFIGPLLIQGLNCMLRAGLGPGMVHRERITAGVRAGYLAPYDSWAHRKAILRFIQEIPVKKNHDNRRLLTELERQVRQFADRPHLLVWGLQDPVFHRGYLAGWRQRFPAAEVQEISDAGHWVLEEVPDRILTVVRDFLSRTE